MTELLDRHAFEEPTVLEELKRLLPLEQERVLAELERLDSRLDSRIPVELPDNEELAISNLTNPEYRPFKVWRESATSKLMPYAKAKAGVIGKDRRLEQELASVLDRRVQEKARPVVIQTIISAVSANSLTPRHMPKKGNEFFSPEQRHCLNLALASYHVAHNMYPTEQTWQDLKEATASFKTAKFQLAQRVASGQANDKEHRSFDELQALHLALREAAYSQLTQVYGVNEQKQTALTQLLSIGGWELEHPQDTNAAATESETVLPTGISAGNQTVRSQQKNRREKRAEITSISRGTRRGAIGLLGATAFGVVAPTVINAGNAWADTPVGQNSSASGNQTNQQNNNSNTAGSSNGNSTPVNSVPTESTQMTMEYVPVTQKSANLTDTSPTPPKINLPSVETPGTIPETTPVQIKPGGPTIQMSSIPNPDLQHMAAKNTMATMQTEGATSEQLFAQYQTTLNNLSITGDTTLDAYIAHLVADLDNTVQKNQLQNLSPDQFARYQSLVLLARKLVLYPNLVTANELSQALAPNKNNANISAYVEGALESTEFPELIYGGNAVPYTNKQLAPVIGLLATADAIANGPDSGFVTGYIQYWQTYQPKHVVETVPHPKLAKQVEKKPAAKKASTPRTTETHLNANQLNIKAAQEMQKLGGAWETRGYLFQLLLEEGLTPQGAAGVIGNLMLESGLNPHNVQNGCGPDADSMPDYIRGKCGYGIVQWTDAGRQQALKDYAKSQGKSSGDLGVQIRFMLIEMRKYPNMMHQLKHVTSVYEATSIFMKQFERPGQPNEHYRQENAQMISGKFGTLYVHLKTHNNVAKPKPSQKPRQHSSVATITNPASNHSEYILRTPNGGYGHDVYYINQVRDINGVDGTNGYDACGLTSLYDIYASLENNDDIPFAQVHQDLIRIGAYSDNAGITNIASFLSYFNNKLHYNVNTIHADYSGPTKSVDLVKVTQALKQNQAGKPTLILVATRNKVSVRDGGATSGHWLVLYGVDKHGNYLVANVGNSNDSPRGGYAIRPNDIKNWLEAFYAISK